MFLYSAFNEKTKGMKITLLQTDIRWHEPQENIRTARRLMAVHPGSDLYVLPEMWATGFDTALPADNAEGVAILDVMRQLAAERDANVLGSIAMSDGGRLYNRACFVRPDGETTFYDKRHLFSYGGEDRTFTPGHERVIVDCRSVRILLQTCYDLRFPVFSRCRGDYDMIVYVASWPASRREAWTTLLRARAIENQCYVAGINRTGNDPLTTYDGGSLLIDAYGRSVLDLGTTETAQTATLDMERQEKFRKKFPVLGDADNFSLNI